MERVAQEPKSWLRERLEEWIRNRAVFKSASVDLFDLIKLKSALGEVERDGPIFKDVHVVHFPRSHWDMNAGTALKRLMVSEGLLRTLDRDELVGVIAHEAGHAKRYRLSMGIRLTGAAVKLSACGSFIGFMAVNVSVFAPFGLLALPAFAVSLYLGANAVGFVVNSIRAVPSRIAELRADRNALNYVDKEVMISALTKISHETHMTGQYSTLYRVKSYLQSTHPTLKKRIKNLEKHAARMDPDGMRSQRRTS